MTPFIRYITFIVSLIAIFTAAGCTSDVKTPGGDGEAPPATAPLEFGDAYTLTEPGIIDAPSVVEDRNGRNLFLTYLYNDAGSQRIQYVHYRDGEMAGTSLLSEQEGTKVGGGRLAILGNELTAYWINVKATGGQLRYRSRPIGGGNFTRPAKLNRRNEARWPVLLDVNDEVAAFFFINARNDWELVANFNFSDEDEPTVDIPQGYPFHLQGISGPNGMVWLSYFERARNEDFGRIVFLKSTNKGENFLRKYLFDDLKITNLTSYFSIKRTGSDNHGVIHVTYTEELPESTTIYYSRSTDDGESFTVPFAVFTSGNSLTRSPLLLAVNNYVVILTADTESSEPAMRYVYSDDSGETFLPAFEATNAVASPGTLVGIIRPNGTLTIIWDDIASDPTVGEQLFRMDASPAR